ncbi:acyl-CoA dehydrogenase family protein [Xylophilus sp.]|uniref:acyl-CoA dehydrogenase family protein n=1 Tax=Xylophilus sp. TaxID=2653893 RepID=UPI0013B65DF0|nr:acyl-CoA dehydrogenase family protein [Xylophilus sp.]KAF1042881.1 MAG: Dibenzothiophene desulfurization enzyme C [Xylophilus sp.]
MAITTDPFDTHPAGNPWLARGQALRDRFAEDAIARDQAGGRPAAQIGWLKDEKLLALLLPTAVGGQGEPWSTGLRIVRTFAQVDGSLGHLFGYHYNALLGLGARGAPARVQELWRETAVRQWFWGNTANSFSRSLFGRADGDGFVLDGYRPFTSGSHVADYLSIAWEDAQTDERRFAAIPADRAGLTIEDDWDGIGQRQTGSGRVTYRGVRVHGHEVLGPPVPFNPASSSAPPHRTLGALTQQSVLLNVFVGSAQGALLAARAYTLNRSRPWVHSGVQRHQDDPWVQSQYGDLWTQTRAAAALADRALAALDHAWARGEALTAQERGEAAVAVAAANVLAGEVALRVTGAIFELTGARSATREHGLDRFWRNVRIHTLHNPAEYKTRNVGRWQLGEGYPAPGVFQ